MECDADASRGGRKTVSIRTPTQGVITRKKADRDRDYRFNPRTRIECDVNLLLLFAVVSIRAPT